MAGCPSGIPNNNFGVDGIELSIETVGESPYGNCDTVLIPNIVDVEITPLNEDKFVLPLTIKLPIICTLSHKFNCL